MHKKYIIVIGGPTGVGKSDVGIQLAHEIDGEIINADVGQFYRPLTIGTAKPDWQHETVPHHLFDILDKPIDFTVDQFRQKLLLLIKEIQERNKVPIIVGGSHFYLACLFFPPRGSNDYQDVVPMNDQESLWQLLQTIDPDRAAQLHPHDTYRITRALHIWYATGKKPSAYKPVYDPPAPYFFLTVLREREELYQRINKRVETMIKQGWLDEVQSLLATEWEPFLLHKKLIGYDDIIRYLRGNSEVKSMDQLIAIIAQKTRQYAKRQIIFLRALQKKLEKEIIKNPEQQDRVIHLNLTDLDVDLYIKQLSRDVGAQRKS